MATITIYPDGDITYDWYYPTASQHYIQVDDAITYPTNPTGDSNRIMADGFLGADNNQYDRFTFDNPPGVGTVTRIDIYAFGQIDNDGGAGNYPELSYSNNGGSSWSSDYNLSSFPSNNTPATGVSAWHTIAITGISWTQAQINDFQIRIRGDVPDGSKSVLSFNCVYALQVLVTYTPAAVGPANVAKFDGVSLSNIAKINGIAIANILKINGVG